MASTGTEARRGRRGGCPIVLNVLPVTTVYFETPFTPSSFLLQTPFAVVAALDRRRKIQKQP